MRDLNFSNFKIIDLTHEIHEGIPTWSGGCGFKSKIELDYKDIGCRVMSYQTSASAGTHMDAPTHFVPGGKNISDLEVENFVAPLCVLKISCNDSSDYFVSEEDVKRYEQEHGKIPKRSVVVVDTGWAKRWKTPELYRNMDEQNQMHFPGYGLDAAKILLERGVVGLGIDTLSIDGSNLEFPVHHFLLPEGKYFVENMARLDEVPPSGSWVIILPPKIRGAAEAPCRAIALVPKS